MYYTKTGRHGPSPGRDPDCVRADPLCPGLPPHHAPPCQGGQLHKQAADEVRPQVRKTPPLPIIKCIHAHIAFYNIVRQSFSKKICKKMEITMYRTYPSFFDLEKLYT